MSYYGYYPHGPYPGYHSHPGQNWTPGPPASVPPSTGKAPSKIRSKASRLGAAIQFGSLPPTQMEQHGYTAPHAMFNPAAAGFSPYSMPLMAPQGYPGYPPMQQPPPPPSGTHPRKNEAKPRASGQQRGDTPPTTEEQGPDAKTPPPQSMSPPMMHPYAQMTYYPPPYPYHPAYGMAPPVDPQLEAAQGGFKTKGQNSRIQSESNAKTRGNASTHAGGRAKERNDQHSPRSATSVPKKRLQFVNPETLAPVENFPAQMSTPIPSSLAPKTNNTPIPNTASSMQEDVSKLVSEVIASTKDKTPSGRITSKVKTVEFDTPKSAKTTMKRTPVQTTTLKKIIDPSNGAYHPGPFKSGPVQSGPQQKTHYKRDQTKWTGDSSFRDKVLNTVASIERNVEEESSKKGGKKTGKKQGEVDTPPQEKEAVEEVVVPHQKLILDSRKTGRGAKKTESQDQGVKVERQAKAVKIVVGSRVIAPKSKPRMELDSPMLKEEVFKQEQDSPNSKQDASIEELDSAKAKQDDPKQEQDILKKEQDVAKEEQDVSKEEQDILKKEQDVVKSEQEQDDVKSEQDSTKEEQELFAQEQDISKPELQDSTSVETAPNLTKKLQSLPAIKTSLPESPSSKDTASTGTQTSTVTPTSEDRVSITVGTQTTPQSPTSEDRISITVGTQTLKEAPVQDPTPPPLTQQSSDLTDTSIESPMTKSQPTPKRSGSGKQLSSFQQSFNRRGSGRSSKGNPIEVFHMSSGNRRYSFDFLKSFKAQFQDKPTSIESIQCLRDFEGSRMIRSGSEKWLRQHSIGRGGFEERNVRSLNRNFSGRSGSGSLTTRGRLSRTPSGQKGEEGAKWGKSDLSSFASGSYLSNIPLHKSENKYIIGAYQTDDPEEEKRQKTFKGLLNKLTPDNFEKMFEKFKEVEISDPKTLRGLIDQIFDKALIETTFCPLYSELCKLLSAAVPEFEEQGDVRKITFRRLLLNKCQAEYEKGDAAARAEKEAKNKVKNEVKNEAKNENTTEVKNENTNEAKNENTTEVKNENTNEVKNENANEGNAAKEDNLEKLAAAKKERMRSLGNMQFIGYLFQKGMLTEKIIHTCIRELLREDENPKPEDIECLAKLITTVGKLLPNDKNLDAYFTRIDRLSTNQKLETRHRFMLVDLIELRGRRWIERREKEGPKRIEEIHRHAMAEQQAQNARNRVNYTPERRDSGRGRSPWGRSPKTRQNTPFSNPQEEVRPLTRNLSLGRTSSSDISLRPSSMVTLSRPKSPSSPSKASPVQEQASRGPPLEGEALDKKVKSLLDEYYNVKDLEEALQCMKELSENNASKPEILKSTLLQSLDIRSVEVDQRLTPMIPIITEILSRKLFVAQEVKQGLKLTMIALPDIAEDFPKAPGLIGRMFGALVANGVVPLKPLLDPQTGIILSAGKEENSEEDSPLIDAGFGSAILIEMLKEMKKKEDQNDNNKTVKEALKKENANLSLFYPAYLRGEVDLEKDLRFLES